MNEAPPPAPPPPLHLACACGDELLRLEADANLIDLAIFQRPARRTLAGRLRLAWRALAGGGPPGDQRVLSRRSAAALRAWLDSALAAPVQD